MDRGPGKPESRRTALSRSMERCTRPGVTDLDGRRASAEAHPPSSAPLIDDLRPNFCLRTASRSPIVEAR